MKRYTTIALTGIVFAVTLGMLGANGFLAAPFGITETTTTMNGGIPMKGHLTLVLYNADGAIKAYRQMDNIVVNAGKECAGARIFGTDVACSAPATFNYIAIGTGTGSELTADTTLGAQIGSRVQDTSNAITSPSGSTGALNLLSALFTGTSTNTIAESGIFDSAAGGEMFSRKQISPTVNVASGDTLTVTWTITTG